MCLSIPARIVSIDGSTAQVSAGGSLFRAGIQMIHDPRVGDYVLLHAGFAIQKISEKDALETIRLIREMNELGEE
jgi:hydrogenase expression/formation protein HypC